MTENYTGSVSWRLTMSGYKVGRERAEMEIEQLPIADAWRELEAD